MRQIAEFIGFNLWLFAVTGIAVGVFRTLALLIQSAALPEWVSGWLYLLICIPAFVATWYFVGSRSMRLIQRLYDRKR